MSTFESVFDENAQRFSVDRRPKRIEMYAFSNENALVWTGSKPIALLTFPLLSPSSLLKFPISQDGSHGHGQSKSWNLKFAFHARIC